MLRVKSKYQTGIEDEYFHKRLEEQLWRVVDWTLPSGELINQRDGLMDKSSEKGYGANKGKEMYFLLFLFDGWVLPSRRYAIIPYWTPNSNVKYINVPSQTMVKQTYKTYNCETPTRKKEVVVLLELITGREWIISVIYYL